MSIAIILYCGWVALAGAVLHFLIEANDVQKTSGKANVEFSLGRYLKDQKISILISLFTILLALSLASELLNWKPEVMGWKNSIFAFIGFSSDYIANMLFGVAKKRLVAAIDDKTTQIDRVNNTVDRPTPATLPTDKPL